MLPVFISDISLPLRRFARSRLFATTALISLAALPGAARADMELDNDRLGWGWSSINQIWLDEDGDHQVLPATETGVLVGDSSTPELRIWGRVEAGGLRLSGGNFRLHSGTLAAGAATLQLAADGGSRLFIDSDVDGDLEVSGNGQIVLRGESEGDISVMTGGSVLLLGESSGDITNAGEVNLSADRTGNIVNNRLLGLGGLLDGDVTNNSRVNLRGEVDGQFDNAGNTYVVGNSTLRDLTNTAAGLVEVTEGNTLRVSNLVENAGRIAVAGDLRADIDNQAGSRLTMTGGTMTGDVGNDGTIDGTGTIDGIVTNGGQVNTVGDLTVDALVNDGQVNVRTGDRLAIVEGPLLNNDRLTVNAASAAGWTTAPPARSTWARTARSRAGSTMPGR